LCDETIPHAVFSITNKSTVLTVVFGWNVVINLFYIPGTMGGAFIIDYLGPKNTMILGLLCQAVFGFIMCGAYTHLVNHIGAFAVIYGIFLSFGELGPGNNLGLLAAKTSPTAVRGQFYGFAAAVGKVGAFIGTYTFPNIETAFGKRSATLGITGTFWVASGLAILSALITFFFIRPLTTDGMAEEDHKVRATAPLCAQRLIDVAHSSASTSPTTATTPPRWVSCPRHTRPSRPRRMRRSDSASFMHLGFWCRLAYECSFLLAVYAPYSWIFHLSPAMRATWSCAQCQI
jgi:hypothetical protein